MFMATEPMPVKPSTGLHALEVQLGDVVDIILQNTPSSSFNGDYRSSLCLLAPSPWCLYMPSCQTQQAARAHAGASLSAASSRRDDWSDLLLRGLSVCYILCLSCRLQSPSPGSKSAQAAHNDA